MNVDPNTKVQPFIAVAVAPKPHRTSNDSQYDLEYFEDLAGAGTSESEFLATAYDARRAGRDVDAIYDRNGRFDRARGVWINRDRSEITTKQLLQKLAARQ
jgi:hypothetical protein